MLEGLKRINEYEWEVPVGYTGNMRVPGRIFISEKLMGTLEGGAVQQLANTATLPGIVKYSLAMPDIHWGYGFPIGGVAAFSMDDGVISPGGVGFDINCGVRLMTTPLHSDDFTPKIQKAINVLFSEIPAGVGGKSGFRLDRKELSEVMTGGVSWVIERGYGIKEDMEHCEDSGRMMGADPVYVSDKAFTRGKNQLMTLGSGNHFLEIQAVDEIFDEETAKIFGVREGQICVMIHCGSRGLGHQVCTDHINTLEKAVKRYGISLPDRQLACAPVTSDEGGAYFAAMACSANYAWANRQAIMHKTRKIFESLFGIAYEDMHLVYDVAHNIAKMEEHDVGGKMEKLCVHRKGATRCFGPGSSEIPLKYKSSGQPVIIPGSMGTRSYLLKGTKTAMEKTFGSTCHGSGRVLSRSRAKKELKGTDIREELFREGIYVKASHDSALAEEAPQSYKESRDVIEVVSSAGLAGVVAAMRPVGVIKG